MARRPTARCAPSCATLPTIHNVEPVTIAATAILVSGRSRPIRSRTNIADTMRQRNPTAAIPMYRRSWCKVVTNHAMNCRCASATGTLGPGVGFVAIVTPCVASPYHAAAIAKLAAPRYPTRLAVPPVPRSAVPVRSVVVVAIPPSSRSMTRS